jgi:hypothetical protein
MQGIIAEELKIETGRKQSRRPSNLYSSLIHGLSVEFLHPTLWSIKS